MTFKLSTDTETLVEFLLTTPDHFVSYEALGELLDLEDIRNGKRHILTSAMRILKNKGRMWDTLQTIGIRRLDDTGTLRLAQKQSNKGRNAFTRVREALDNVEREALDEQDRIVFDNESILCGIALCAASPKVRKKDTHSLSTDDVLSMVKAHIEKGQL